MKGMPQLKGTPLDKGVKLNFVWNADLVSFDGPLISLYKKGDDDFLFVWVDCDQWRNRWVVVPIERRALQGYLTLSVSLLQIFVDSDVVLVFESTKSGQKRNYRYLPPYSLPQEYLPKQGSFLSPSIASESAINLAADLPKAYNINLDGELYLDDLASIPKLYQQLYSFHYGLAHLARDAVKEALTRLLEKWHGGINAVNIFTGLRSVTPSIHRAQIKELKFASPGYIRLELLPNLAKEINAACDRITPLEDFKRAESLYSEIYSYFKSEKLGGFETDRAARSRTITKAQATRLSEFVDEYFDVMGWSSHAGNFAALGLDPLSKLRMLLAYYRRLRSLRRYVVEKRVDLT